MRARISRLDFFCFWIRFVSIRFVSRASIDFVVLGLCVRRECGVDMTFPTRARWLIGGVLGDLILNFLSDVNYEAAALTYLFIG